MKSFYFLIIPLLFIVLPSCKKSDIQQPKDPREQFIGSWKATDSFTESNGTIVTQTYTFNIDLDLNSAEFILLDRFANLSLTDLSAKVSSNSFIITNTEASINNLQVDFEANGEINSQKLTYRYSMVGSGINREYTGSAVR
ncbi:MAG: hypothetical protein IPI60_01620 [Saprospiraceae bacterium]|jgi:hypothetical protein|nr:hypothetical protein [Saprospiraceae bacterium]